MNDNGKNTSLYTRDDVYIIRSIPIKNNKLNIEATIKELFVGRLNSNIEYYATPSTILINNSNVIMASQILDRVSSEKLSSFSRDINNFEQYHEIKTRHIGTDMITWVGCPSLVYDYKKRSELKDMLNQNTCLNMLFWLTSFRTTECISSLSNFESYCNKTKQIKDTCVNAFYQNHGTFSNFKKEEKELITSFDKAFTAIKNEELSISIFNQENRTVLFQRYNELLTFLYPWDLTGIEIGACSITELTELITGIIEKREYFYNIYRYLYNNKSYFLKFINNFYKFADIKLLYNGSEDDNAIFFKKIKFDIQNIFNIEPLYILSKFLMECECSNVHILVNLKPLLLKLMSLLRKPLEIFEYKMNQIENVENITFSMIKKGDYSSIKSDLLNRLTPFWLFDQYADPSDIQTEKKDIIAISTIQFMDLINKDPDQDGKKLSFLLRYNSIETVKYLYKLKLRENKYRVYSELEPIIKEEINDVKRGIGININKKGIKRSKNKYNNKKCKSNKK